MEESEHSAPLTPSEPRGFGGSGTGRVRAGQSSGEAIPEAGIHLHPAGAWDRDGLRHLSQSLTGDAWDWGHRGILGVCRRSGSVHDPGTWKGKIRNFGGVQKVRGYPWSLCMEREVLGFWGCSKGQGVSMIPVHGEGSSGIWGCAENQGVSMTLVHGKGSLGILGV